MMAQMHIIHRPGFSGDGWEADAHLVFLSPLCQYPFTPSHLGLGNASPGCSCKITFSCPGHTILTTTFTKIRKIGTITSFVRVVENWNSWFGHKEENERTLNLFNQIAIINQYFSVWQTTTGYGSEEMVVGAWIQLLSVTSAGALDAFYEG